MARDGKGGSIVRPHKWFFTADEHYNHHNIIKYCKRPFENVAEMNHTLIENHNKIVAKNDIVVHVGDFTLDKSDFAQSIIKQLNGNHIFLNGSHDRWLNKTATQLWEKKIDEKFIVACHYAMHVWPRSHYGAWHIFGHSHGQLALPGKRYDVGVDNNDFYPVSFDNLCEIMLNKEDNANLVKKQF